MPKLRITLYLRDSQRGAFLSRNSLLASGKIKFSVKKSVQEDIGKKEIENLLSSFDLNPCGDI